jgi:hypothetical protein
MQPVLVDDGLNLGQVGDLMDQGRRILAVQVVATTPAGMGLAIAGRPEFLGRDQRAERLGMAGLCAAASSGGRSRRLALRSDRIGGGRLGRVGRVLVEPALELVDPLVEGVQEGQKRGLGLRRTGVPERLRNRRLRQWRDDAKDTTNLLNKRFGP